MKNKPVSSKAYLLPTMLTIVLTVSLLPAPAVSASVDVETELYVVRVVTLAAGLEHPWGLAFLPDGRMLVTERPGRLRYVERTGKISEPLMGVPEVFARGQGGLLDIALDPGFSANKMIYLSYAEQGKDGGGTAVGRGRLTDQAIKDFKVIFRQVPKADTRIHFGSRLVFSRDGRLFITLGERGERERAQDLSVHRGQVIRILPDGEIPPDNPFEGHAKYRPEVWSYGHRNPQGAALHPGTGRLWTVEHGAKGGDEINIPRQGRNYGWPIISYGRHYSGLKIGEGTRKTGMEQPVYYWDPSIAPSGMAFVTSDQFEAWKGNLLVGALRGRMLVRLELDGDKVVREESMLSQLNERIRDVRQGPDGYIYLLTDSGKGRILRLEPII